MVYPFLEFDPNPEAFIEPYKLIQPQDFPDIYVVCFFEEVIDMELSMLAIQSRY